MLDNLALVAQVKVALIKDFPTVNVSAEDGAVFISIKAPLSQQKQLTAQINSIVDTIEGVTKVSVFCEPVITPD